MHEIQHTTKIKKKFPAFRTDTKMLVSRNFTEIADTYSHNQKHRVIVWKKRGDLIFQLTL
jgi:hypothetical protein